MQFNSLPVNQYAEICAANVACASLNETPPTLLFKAVGREWYYGITFNAGESELCAVMNNDITYRGALPFILESAIRHGVTELNAWNIKSTKHPSGWLSSKYKEWGFVEVRTEAYDASYGPPTAALKKAWRTYHWQPSDQCPSVVHMHREPAFTFVSLFAGAGGARLATTNAGGRCVASVERDKFARLTYQANFLGDNPATYFQDIVDVEAAALPECDFLTAGFPCQPFSIAGVSKKNALGRPHGFADIKQGNLFFDIVRILEAKRPAAFLLENVKNITSHDKGQTFKVILGELQRLGYFVSHRVVNAKGYVPQNRERTFIAGFRDPVEFTLNDVNVKDAAKGPKLGSILDSDVDPRYTLTAHMWAYLQAYAAKHKAAGHGFGFGLVGPDDTTRTLSARYYKDGSEILVKQPHHRPRRLTPREAGRLMGFPDSFHIPVSDTQAYRQFGNSVVVPEVQDIVTAMVPFIQQVSRYGQRQAA